MSYVLMGTHMHGAVGTFAMSSRGALEYFYVIGKIWFARAIYIRR